MSATKVSNDLPGGKTQQEAMEILRQYVDQFTQITYKANLIANAYFLQIGIIDENFEFFDVYTFFRRVMELVKVGTRRQTILTIKNEFPGLVELVDDFNWRATEQFHQDNAINYEAKHYKASLKNLKDLADPAHLQWYLLAVYPNIIRKKWVAKMVAKHILWGFRSGWTGSITTDEVILKAIISIEIDRLRMYADDNIVHVKPEDDEDDLARTDSIALIKWRFYLRKTIMESETKECMKKNFTLGPIHSMKPRFAHLDVAILGKLMIHGCQSTDLKKIDFMDFFHTDLQKNRPTSFKNDPDTIPRYAKTNGYEIHFLFQRIMNAEEKIYAALTDDERNEHLIQQLKDQDIRPDQVIGIDPGVTHLVVGASPTSPEYNGMNQREVHVAKEGLHEWRQNSLMTDVTKKEKKLIEKAKEMDEEIENLLIQEQQQSLKRCSTIDECIDISIFKFSVFQKLNPIYNNKKFLKFKFNARRRRQREMDRIVDFVMTQGKENPVVALGNARNLTGFKKLGPPAPYMKIFRHARKRLKGRGHVIDIDEFCTSKYATCCISEHTYMKNQENETVRGLFHCKKCHQTLNRDVSAAQNILKIALTKLNIGVLPQDAKMRQVGFRI